MRGLDHVHQLPDIGRAYASIFTILSTQNDIEAYYFTVTTTR